MGKDNSNSTVAMSSPCGEEPASCPIDQASQSHAPLPCAAPRFTADMASWDGISQSPLLNPKGSQNQVPSTSTRLTPGTPRKRRASQNLTQRRSNSERLPLLLTLLLGLLLVSGFAKGYVDLGVTEVSALTTGSSETSLPESNRNNVDFMIYPAHGGFPLVISGSFSTGTMINSYSPYAEPVANKAKIFPSSRNTFAMAPDLIIYANDGATGQIALHTITFGSPTTAIIAAGQQKDYPAFLRRLYFGVSWPGTNLAYFGTEYIECIRYDVQTDSFSQHYSSGVTVGTQEILKIQGDALILCEPITYYFIQRIAGTEIKQLTLPDPFGLGTLAEVDNLSSDMIFIRSKSDGQRVYKHNLTAPGPTWPFLDAAAEPDRITNINNMGAFTLIGVTSNTVLSMRFYDKGNLALKLTANIRGDPILKTIIRTIEVPGRGQYFTITTTTGGFFNIQSYYLGESNFCLKRPLQICEECSAGYYRNNLLANNNCILPAAFPPAYGIHGLLGAAYPCSTANCAVCLADYSICTTCSPGFWLDDLSCVACTSPCANCSTSAITCTSCIATFSLTGTNTCVNCGAANFFNSVTTACDPCTSPCQECQTTATHCLACISGYNLTPSNTCIQCSAGDYFNGTGCAACTSPCLTCTGSATTCSSCIASYSHVVASNTCIQCTATEYFTGTACAACSSPCSGCSTNASTCTSCIATYNYVSASNTCIACSGSQYFTGSNCAACSSPCSACVTLATQCTACILTYHLTSSNTCINCASNEYFNGTTACITCNSPCATCSGSATHCLSCIAAYNLTTSNTCITCTSVQYFNGTTSCLPCNANCLTCVSTATNCVTCPAGWNKTPSNTCIQCTSNQFFNGTICVNCTSPCLTCSNASTCLTCIVGYNLTPSNTCIQCLPNEFFNGTVCAGCNSPCHGCVTSPTTCTSCIATYNYASSTNDCHLCTSNQYFTGAVCAACQAQCQTCSGPSSNNCLSCVPARNFYNNQCFLCTSAQYWSGTACVSCHTNCLTCNGGTSSNCLTCAAPKNLTTMNTCITCSAGQYFNGTNACNPCNSPCLNCTSPTNCTSCVGSHRLVGGNKCTNCAVGHFSNPYPSCSACTAPCSDCITDANTCLACVFPKVLAGNVCNDCPSAQYLPPSPALPICTACSPLCQNCANSDTECTSCTSGKYLTPSNTCITCGTYEYFDGVGCAACVTPCVQCSGLTVCNSCVAGTNLTPGNQCVTCTPTQRFNGTACVNCTSPCSGCSTSVSTCTSCVANHFLIAATNTCLFCTSSQYFDGTFCQPCDPGCLSCANSATFCTACPPSQHLTPSNTCITCLSSQYFNGTNCQNCTSPCATCSAATTCLTCIAAHFLTPTNTCITCAAGEFFNGVGCSLCTSPCASCTISATNCLSCIPTYNKTPANTCIYCSPSQYFTGSTCQACTSPCASCVTSATQCTVCIPSYHLKTSNNTCIFCAQTQYFDGTLCQNCSLNCLTCAGSFNNCTGCSSGQFLDGNAQCVPCHSTCASCTSNSSSACTTCAIGFQLISNMCAPLACDPGKFLNIALCDNCAFTCLTCAGSATTCTTCATGRYLSNSACLTCHSTCTICSGPTSSECSACVPGTQLSGTSCITSYCPPSKWMNNGFCTNCHSECLTCNGGNQNQCQSCLVGKMVSNGYCVNITCPAGKYLSGNDCFNCNPYCSTCQGEGVNACITCPAGFTLKNNGFCERNCASNEYNDNALNLCRPCSAACLTCYKAGEYGCTSCKAGSTLRFDGLCLKSCSAGFYYLQASNECFMCHASCKNCSGPSSLECSECKAGLLVQLDRSCKTGCPPNAFIENNTKCTACHSSCATCSSASDLSCTQCRSGLYKHPTGKCEGTVPEGYYLDVAAGAVFPCHSTCKSCEGPLETHCTSCKDSMKDRLSSDQKCIDCIAQALENKLTCSSFVAIKLTKPSARAVNSAASQSVRLGFEGESSYSTSLTPKIFQESVKMEILNMNPSEYTLQLSKREGEYCIDVFSTVSMDSPVTLKVTPITQQVLTDPSTGQSTLVFLQNPAVFVMALSKAPNASAMATLSSMTESSQGPMQAVSTAASFFAMISILATTPLMTPFLKFLKIFKLLSRLKLINVFFGGYLEFVLMMSGMMFELGGDSQTLQFLRFDSNTRGKLTKFAITPVSVEVMWVKYMVYYLIVLVRVYQAKLRVYIKKRKHFDPQDQIVDKVADESRIIIFTMVVIDIFFYSAHCVSHMNLAIPQSRDSTISLILSFITIIAVSIDILLLVISNSNMNVSKVLWERKKVEIMARNDRIRDKRIQLWKAGTPHDAPAYALEEGPTSSKKSPMPPKRLKENASEAAVRFFTEGIQTDKVQEGKFFNTISLLKLIAVEPFYVTLQMFPSLQIGILFALQLTYYIYFLRMAFKKKIFISKVDVVQIFINELSILVFLGIGLIFQLGGGVDNFSTGLATGMQISGILVVAVTGFLGAGIIILSIIKSVAAFLKAKKFKKTKDEYNKVFSVGAREAIPEEEGEGEAKSGKEGEVPKDQAPPKGSGATPLLEVPKGSPSPPPLPKKRARNLLLRNRNQEKVTLSVGDTSVLPKTVMDHAEVPDLPAKEEKKKLLRKKKIIGSINK
jgi:hypothetical protein